MSNTKGLNGATLKKLREKAGLSQAKLSVAVGKNRGWASRVEMNNLPIGKSDARALCAALGCKLSDFGLKEGDVGRSRQLNVEALLSAMEEKGFSGRQFAKLIGVHHGTFYRWTNRGAQPEDDRTVELMAETLEVPVEHLYRETEENESIRSVEVVGATKATPAAKVGAGRVLIAFDAAAFEQHRVVLEHLAGHELVPVSADALSALLSSLSLG